MAKAGRPRKGSAGLPAWFDIEKYRPLKNFKALEWCQQLTIRFILLQHFEADAPDEVADALWARLVDLLKANPIITLNHLVAAEQQHKGQKLVELNDVFQAINLIISMQAAGVHDATNRQIYEAYDQFPKKVREYLSGDNLYYAGLSRILFKEKSSPTDVMDAHDFLESTHDKEHEALTSVDLSLPTEVLLNEFKDYILQKRKQFGNPANPFFKNPDFKSWYNCGCLPYLDLMILDSATDKSMRWSAFATALNKIVDKPIGSESALIKSVKSNADKLMNISTIRLLQSQAAREKPDTVQKSGKLIVR